MKINPVVPPQVQNVHKRSIFYMEPSSSAHTFGNITLAFRQYLIDNFKNEFFKFTYVDTSSISRVIQNEELMNKEFIKQNKPSLKITLDYELNQDDIFLGNTQVTTNMASNGNAVSIRQLHPFFKDKENDFFLAYKINRDRIIFNTTMEFSTKEQQIDEYKNILNKFKWGRSFYIYTCLEFLIPSVMINYLFKMNNIDPESSSYNIMMKYLRKYSDFPITYKIRDSTGKENYFLYSNSTLLATFEQLELGKGTRKGMAEDSYPISFIAKIDFNNPIMFYLIGNAERKIEGYSFDLIDSSSGKTSRAFSVFTINNLYEVYAKRYKDKQFFITFMFRTEEDKHRKEDRLEIGQIFNPEQMEVLKEHIVMDLDMNIIIQSVLLEDSKQLMENVQWYIDWNRFEVVILNSNSNSTYRMIIYINNDYMNKMIIANMERKKNIIK